MPTIAQTIQNALALHKAGNFAQAEQLYRQVLAIEPANFDALHLMGILAYQVRNYPAAVDLFTKALAQRPNDVETRVHIANAYRALHQIDKAIENSSIAIRLSPNHINANVTYAAALTDLNRLTEAEQVWKKLLQLQPGNAAHYSNLGTTYERMGRVTEAIQLCQRAVELNPNYAHAHNNLGAALAKVGRLSEAIRAHTRAVELNPNFADAWLNLANCNQEAGNGVQARAAAERAAAIDANNPRPYRHLAIAAEDAGLVDEARRDYDRAIELFSAQPPTAENQQWLPRLKMMRAILLPPVYASLDDLDARRQRLEENVRALKHQNVHLRLEHEAAPTLFHLAYHGRDDRPITEVYTSMISPPDIPIAPPKRTEKIKVGFVSRFFKNHTIGRLNQGLIAELDRQRFEVTVFSLGESSDEIAKFIRDRADHYIPVPIILPGARAALHQHPQNVLFYTDLGMDPITYGLAFSRLAPIQCLTWGHPVTSGIPNIDYFISSEVLDPPGNDSQYTERLVRLKNLGVYYRRPMLTGTKTRADFGLPEDAHLYGCLQMLWKFHPEFDEPIAQILRRDPKGYLVLIHGLNMHWDELLLERFTRVMPDVVDRILFLPRQNYDDFLALTALCDVSLDPIHFGGGNTTYEALAFAVPVITLPSPYLRGRLTIAMYRMMQMDDCVATSVEDYVHRAVDIASDRGHAQDVRRKIRERSDVLFENRDAVRELETFLTRAVTR